MFCLLVAHIAMLSLSLYLTLLLTTVLYVCGGCCVFHFVLAALQQSPEILIKFSCRY